MSKKDKLMGMKEGDKWFSVMAPEELRFWNKKHPWHMEKEN